MITTLSVSCCNRWMEFLAFLFLQDSRVMCRYDLPEHTKISSFLLFAPRNLDCNFVYFSVNFQMAYQLLEVILPLLKHLSRQKDVRPVLHEMFHMPEWFQQHGIPASRAMNEGWDCYTRLNTLLQQYLSIWQADFCNSTDSCWLFLSHKGIAFDNTKVTKPHQKGLGLFPASAMVQQCTNLGRILMSLHL